jgi:hypothetical protein
MCRSARSARSAFALRTQRSHAGLSSAAPTPMGVGNQEVRERMIGTVQ